MENRHLTNNEIKYGIQWVSCCHCLSWHKIQCVSSPLLPFFCSRECEINHAEKK